MLDAIGEPRDLTLLRAPGQPSDDPTLERVRELLADQIYREVAFERVCEVTGDTVVLDGGPGFTRAAPQLMSRARELDRIPVGLGHDRRVVARRRQVEGAEP